jgi:hypothetical protein
MSKLQSTSDVVCLFTERSLERPWILFEAGVAKGKLNTPVVGVARGVPLSRVSAGPFYQFQNMDDSETEFTKLVHQLARRIPSLELDSDVVKVQVGAFKTTEATILKTLVVVGKNGAKDETDENPLAKLAEEMKALPSRVAERLMEAGDPIRRRRMRRLHPAMFEELMHVSGDPGDPVGILMAASILRDDAPWLYELALEVSRAVKSGDRMNVEIEMSRLQRFSEFGMRGPFMEEFGIGGKETHMLFREFQRMLEHMLIRTLESDKLRRPSPGRPEQP